MLPSELAIVVVSIVLWPLSLLCLNALFEFSLKSMCHTELRKANQMNKM